MTRMKLVVYITAFLGTVLYAYNYLNPPQTWEVENKKAITAFHKSQFDEAEKHFVQALKLAETFSVKDPRLYFSLGQLAEFYRIQSMFLKAEKVLHHTLVIDDKVFGPKHYNKALKKGLETVSTSDTISITTIDSIPIIQHDTIIYQKFLTLMNLKSSFDENLETKDRDSEYIYAIVVK